MRPVKNGFIFIFIFINFSAFTQVPVGKWRDHFSYNNSHCVADAGDKIYVAGELAIFSYDTQEGTVEELSKYNGLTDSGIKRIAYDNLNNALLIIYENSNIDILIDNTIYNLSDLKRKQISSDKTVYSITFHDDLTYLSCGFGIVVLDIKNMEFSDTYYIGNNASFVKVNDITFDTNNIYAATDQGLFYADLDSQDLADYRNWALLESIPDNDYIFNIVRWFGNTLFANQIDPNTENDTLYEFKNNSWQLNADNELNDIKSITLNENRIVFTTKSVLKVFDQNFNEIRRFAWFNFANQNISVWPDMKYGIVDDSDNLFVADRRFGLVYTNSGITSFLYPDGPSNNSTANVVTVDGKVIITNGNNKAKGFEKPSYSIFENENWETYEISQDTAFNFFSIAVHPDDKDNIFIGSWGYGVFEFQNNIWEDSYNNLNSSLQAMPGYGYGFVRISSMAFDHNNNLWMSNQNVGEPISVRTSENEWLSYNFNGSITNYITDDIVVMENNHKWIILGEGKGLLVLDDKNTPLDKNDDEYKRFSPTTSEGELVSSSVYALEQDKEGNVWVGTEEGVVVYYSPDEVFSDNFYADRIQLTSYGNDTTEQYLLSTDIVTDIETDGADRKWIATQSSGLFMVSDNGREEIHNFNEYNSPLISNTIVDVGINHKSGEVIILTDKGIMSYRSDATEAEDIFGEVYVFPNPVRPGYEGLITVTGLADEVNVKFTDISGNVVFETDALGGQAIWDGKTFDGRKVSTGVYLVFCSNEDGSQTHVTKLLFIN